MRQAVTSFKYLGSGHRRTLAVVAALVFALSSACAPAQAKSPQKHSNDSAKLAKAKRSYRLAQAACRNQHRLDKMHTIVSSARDIKRYGGKARPKSEIYRCMEFRLYFHSKITISADYGDDYGHWGGSFTYNVGGGFSSGSESGVVLKPDYSQPGLVGPHEVDVASPENSDTQILHLLTFDGSASFMNSDNSCTTSLVPSHEGPAGTLAAGLSIDPSAKDPAKTIDLAIQPRQPDENYDYTACDGSHSAVNEQGTWDRVLYQLHRGDAQPSFGVSLCAADIGSGGFTAYGGHSAPLGSARYQRSGTISEPDLYAFQDRTCGALPQWGPEVPQEMSYDVTEDTIIAVTHKPPPWKG